MSPLRIAILLCVLVEAGWMAFDGSRALIVGNYIAPKSGPHQGEIGPWRHVVSAVGIDPHGTPMKAVFSIYGFVWLLLAVAFARGLPWSWTAMLVAAIGAVWFVPVGTVLSVIQVALLLVFRSHLH
jgi:hypothetical protein